jgi:HEAT repeat protein
MTAKGTGSKKLLENPFIGNLIVPIAIILVAGVLIFGVSKILSTDRSYKDLVREMHSKTFGNRWVAAYELSKLIATSQIPEAERPWLVENLIDLYQSTQDVRTKKFIVIALGSLPSEQSFSFLGGLLDSVDAEIKFHIIAAMGNHNTLGLAIPEQKLLDILINSEDKTLKQAAILTLASHRIEAARTPLVAFLANDNQKIRISAALGLINFKADESIPHLKEILEATAEKWGGDWSTEQLEPLKVNILDALIRNEWSVLTEEIEILASQNAQVKVAAKAREVLNILKNNGFRNKK